MRIGLVSETWDNVVLEAMASGLAVGNDAGFREAAFAMASLQVAG